MRDITNDNFGLLIAYVIPGMIVVWSGGELSPTVAGWLASDPEASPTIGGFLYTTIAAVAVGMIISSIRWLIVDTIHHHTGIAQPTWDFGRLQKHISAFLTIVDHQYRYYQFYANTLVSLLVAYVLRRIATGTEPWAAPWETVAFSILTVVCFVTSRDNLAKYYRRTNQMLRTTFRRSR